MSEYLFFYEESMIVCTIIFGILLVHDLVQGDRQERKFRFDNVLLAHIMYFICDGVWAAVIAGAIPRTAFSVLLVNFLLMFLLALVGCSWFFFTAVITDLPNRATRRGKFLIYLPMIVTCGIALIGLIVKPSLCITEDNEPTVWFNTLFLVAPLVYVMSAFAHAMYQATRKENRLNQKLYLVTGIYPLSVVIAGMFQYLFSNAPIFCYSSTIMILLFNLLAMEEQISVDPLTKLNNRGQLMRFAAMETSIHKEDLRTFVIIGDVNGFKKINDQYGHVEGDRALVLIADALRRSAGESEFPPFLGRYGGDEFVLIAFCEEGVDADAEMNAMIQRIRGNLARRCGEEQLPYEITMGFGYAEFRKEDDFIECIRRADKNLYMDKATIRRR